MATAEFSTKTVLLVEADVLVRFGLASHLRACALTVIEAVNADDAKAILVTGPKVDILLSDTQLAGEGSGFVLAQWVRRHRPWIEIILTGSIVNKAQATAEIVARMPECNPGMDAAGLAAKLNAMLAERKRRLRQQPKGAPRKTKQKRA